jgi:cyclophilin family peptidyl-prolyl cis-trans isomerase
VSGGPAGEKGEGKMGKPLAYKGSVFHRVIPGFMCQVPRRATAPPRAATPPRNTRAVL